MAASSFCDGCILCGNTRCEATGVAGSDEDESCCKLSVEKLIVMVPLPTVGSK